MIQSFAFWILPLWFSALLTCLRITCYILTCWHVDFSQAVTLSENRPRPGQHHNFWGKFDCFSIEEVNFNRFLGVWRAEMKCRVHFGHILMDFSTSTQNALKSILEIQKMWFFKRMETLSRLTQFLWLLVSLGYAPSPPRLFNRS